MSHFNLTDPGEFVAQCKKYETLLPRSIVLQYGKSKGYVNFRSQAGEAWNQAGLGSCTAFAICKALVMLGLHPNPSPLFLYTITRMASAPGQPIRDMGANVLDAPIDTIGVASESFMPYTIDQYGLVPSFGQPPSALAFLDARKYIMPRILNFTSSDNLMAIKSNLDRGFIPLIAMLLYPSFMAEDGAIKTGIAPMPTQQDFQKGSVGGHQVVAIGYSDEKKYVYCMNSYDKTWGDNGCFAIPYGMFQLVDNQYQVRVIMQITGFVVPMKGVSDPLPHPSDPTPVPDHLPIPQPTPIPIPDPTPIPQPTPIPTPDPQPTPPLPVPDPTPGPTPMPGPIPGPLPQPIPEPTPGPRPDVESLKNEFRAFREEVSEKMRHVMDHSRNVMTKSIEVTNLINAKMIAFEIALNQL